MILLLFSTEFRTFTQALRLYVSQAANVSYEQIFLIVTYYYRVPTGDEMANERWFVSNSEHNYINQIIIINERSFTEKKFMIIIYWKVNCSQINFFITNEKKKDEKTHSAPKFGSYWIIIIIPTAKSHQSQYKWKMVRYISISITKSNNRVQTIQIRSWNGDNRYEYVFHRF